MSLCVVANLIQLGSLEVEVRFTVYDGFTHVLMHFVAFCNGLLNYLICCFSSFLAIFPADDIKMSARIVTSKLICVSVEYRAWSTVHQNSW